MSGAKMCHYYLQGNCKFGSSCRFSHSDSNAHRPIDSNGSYYEHQPRNANQQHYEYKSLNNKHDNSGDYRNSGRYNQDMYHYDSRINNHNVKNNYTNRNDYYERSSYYEENYNSYKNKNYQPQQNSSRENNGKKTYNSKKNNKNGVSDNQSNHVNKTESLNHNYDVQTSSNRYKKYSNDHFDNNLKKEQGNMSQREKILKLYYNEIKMYRMQMNHMLMNKYWPLTCYNPIGHSPSVELVGSLNLMDVSFEEIRCDYYNVKNICANPKLIHAQVFNELVLKAKKQKEDIISLKDHVLNDLVATFEKCELAKACSTYKNFTPVDQNSYWDMSANRLKTPSDSEKLLQTFSFSVIDKVTDAKDAGPKILMQTEIYGKMDNGFDQENFTDYVPIMPPPKKYCY